MVSLGFALGSYEQMLIVKTFVAVLFGGLIGWTRRTKAAGIRTFILICLGSMFFTAIAIDSVLAGTDKSRIISQLVTGIGFLGAGIIWKHDNSLTGVTTAATVWAAAAVGVAIGLELWTMAGIGTIVISLVLISKKYVLHKYETTHEEGDTLVLSPKEDYAKPSAKNNEKGKKAR